MLRRLLSEAARQYQRKSPREHVLLRPEVYVGPVPPIVRELCVPSGTTWLLNKRSVKYSPALYKICDEILVNAADNVQRGAGMSYIKVEVDGDRNAIVVENDGECIPVVMHAEEQVWVPELVFGTLLTSSNFDDSKARFTGGRHGYGAKLTNIFSKEFSVYVCDAKRKVEFEQRFRENMSVKEDAKIETLTGARKGSVTRITFKPDLRLFGIDALDSDFVDVLKKRVMDIAACNPNLKVYFNREMIQFKSFKEYIEQFPKPIVESIPNEDAVEGDESNVSNEYCVFSTSPNFMVGVGRSADGQFEQTSFVNGIATLRGGTHVDLISHQICKAVLEQISKKHKDVKILPHNIRPFLSVFVNSKIANPQFDSQTKETLTTPANLIYNECEIPQKVMKDILSRTGIVEAVLDAFWTKTKNQISRQSAVRKRKADLLSIPKLDDADWAGSQKSNECTLIVTEGDSAKALAVAGLSIVGRQKFGVFPLRGKMLNVRSATLQAIQKNQELNYLKQIIGLRHDRTYESEEERKSLRYGKVMIMTDQDYDGSHIKGLFINMIHHFWPALLRSNDFLEEFITPLLKARNAMTNEVKEFFTKKDFDKWQSSLKPSELRKWRVKYYKGLGTSTPKEAKEYFSNLQKHRLKFQWKSSKEDKLIDNVFSETQSAWRKDWINSFNPKSSNEIDATKVDYLTYEYFINKELILFSIADNIRSIPSAIDGLKPGQRKILYASLKRNLVHDIKVAQLSGYISEQTMYHHGESSLQSTIVSMAQGFVGTNNIPLFEPVGQFGTRHLGGSDAASARYIYTKLSPFARSIFHPSDDPILEYTEEDGIKVEPNHYVPVIPMALVNGSYGIGTGYMTSVPNYNPLDIIRNIKAKLKGKSQNPLRPYYRNFKGEIETIDASKGKFNTVGLANWVGNSHFVHITELPIGVWTQNYKTNVLEKLANVDGLIRQVNELHTDEFVNFKVALTNQGVDLAKQVGLVNLLKLSHKHSSQMYLFDHHKSLKAYADPRDIIDEFYEVRLDLYESRLEKEISILKADVVKLRNQIRFIGDVVSKNIELNLLSDESVENELKSRGFERLGSPDASQPAESDSNSSFNYLLRMPLLSLTLSNSNRLSEQLHKASEKLAILQGTDIKQLWLNDLEALEKKLKSISASP